MGGRRTRLFAILGVLSGTMLTLAGIVFLGLPVWAMVVPLVAVIYALVVLQNPDVGLVTIVSVFFLPLGLGGVTLLQIVGVSTAGLLVIWFLQQGGKIRTGNLFLPLFLFGMMIILSFYFTRDVGRTAFFTRKWLFNLIFFIILTNFVTNFSSLRKVVWAVIGMASINALVGIYDFLGSTEMQYRSAGLLENENEFGNLAALAFPLALYQYLYGRGALRWLSLLLCAVLAGGVIVSVSRGALLAMIFVFFAIVISERHRLRPLILVAFMALAAYPVLPDYFHTRMDTLVADMEGTLPVGRTEKITTRGYYNTAGIKMWMAHPFIGVGIGNFGYYFIEKEFNPGIQASTNLPAHNIYIEALSEMGTVGFGLLIWVIVLVLRNVIQARAQSRHGPDHRMYLGGIEMMALTVFVASFSSGNLMAEDFWLLVGLTATTRAVVESEQKRVALREVSSPPR